MKRQLPASVRLAARKLRRAQHRQPRLFFLVSPGLAAFMADESPRQCVLAANRVGKTLQAIKKVVDRMARTPGMRVRIVGPTSRRVNRVHTGYFYKLAQDQLDSGSRWRDTRGFNNSNTAVFRNGATCEFMSYQQDPQAGEGDEMDLVLLDEPPPPAFFTSAEARVFSRSGSVWVTMTAVDRPVKYLKEIVQQGLDDRVAGRGPGWSFYQVPLTQQNCPWYDAEQIAEWVRQASRTPWQYHQRILGAWEGVSDSRRYVAFGERNLLDQRIAFLQGWPWPGKSVHLALTVDHGDGAGHAHWALLAWQTRQTRSRVELAVRAVVEWTNPERMSARKEARAVRDMVEAAGVRLEALEFAVGDTNAASKSDAARTLNEVFEQEFARLMGCLPESPRLLFRPARKGPDSVERGIAVVNQLLDDDAGSVRGLQVSELCPIIVEAMRHWDGKDTDLKHPADCIRYGVNAIVEEAGYPPVRLAAA